MLAIDPSFRDAAQLRAQAAERRSGLDRGSPSPVVSSEDTLARARDAMTAGEWSLARDLLIPLVQAQPDNAQLAEYLARARVMAQVEELNATAASLLGEGRYQEAMAKMEEAKLLDPHYRQGRG